jgi:uncharacterized protein
MSNAWAELLMQDHQTTEQVLEAVEKVFAAEEPPPPAMIADAIDYLVSYVGACHNKKEERHLFPLIEQRGIPRAGGPLAVMLHEHDQGESLLETLERVGRSYVNGDSGALGPLKEVFGQYAALLRDHFWKENDILYPMARRVMTAADGTAVVAGIEETERELGPDTRARYYALAEKIMAGTIEDLSLGLDRHVLAAMLNTLPVELSFVDQDDVVRYFSHENEAKIFPRTRGAIGMKVQQCHPAHSVHKVNAILESFKAGRRSVAEFWIDMQGKKIHIRYFPVRNPAGAYVGCLEVVQDITAIQQLTGERRLLQEA